MQIDENFDRYHDPPGAGEEEHEDYSGAGGLGRDVSEPPQGPPDTNDTAREGDTTTQPNHPDGGERDDGSSNVPLLPDLQMTQAFIDTLRTAVLESSGMEQEDIDKLVKT